MGCKYAYRKELVAETLASAYTCPKAASVVIPVLQKLCNSTRFVVMLESSSVFHPAGCVGHPHERQWSLKAESPLWFLLPAQENGEGNQWEIKDSQSAAEKYE